MYYLSVVAAVPRSHVPRSQEKRFPMTAQLKNQVRASCADHNKALSYSGLPLDPLALQVGHKVLLLLPMA